MIYHYISFERIRLTRLRDKGDGAKPGASISHVPDTVHSTMTSEIFDSAHLKLNVNPPRARALNLAFAPYVRNRWRTE